MANARDWEGENIKEFTDIVKKMMILIGALTIAACVGGLRQTHSLPKIM